MIGKEIAGFWSSSNYMASNGQAYKLMYAALIKLTHNYLTMGFAFFVNICDEYCQQFDDNQIALFSVIDCERIKEAVSKGPFCLIPVSGSPPSTD
jgi:hypothetical protein